MIVCIASRGRPQRLWQLIRSALSTQATCKFYIRLDDDDPCLAEYRKNLSGLNIGPRVSVAQAQQECFGRYPDEDCYAFIGDDTILRTRHWDQKLKEVAGRWRIAFPDDGLNGAKQATHPFIGGDFLRAIGFWALPGLTHLYTDTVWDFLGRTYGNLVYCPEILVEHMHWSAGKCVRDAIYAKPTAAKDQQCFLRWSSEYQIDPGLRSSIAASVPANSS